MRSLVVCLSFAFMMIGFNKVSCCCCSTNQTSIKISPLWQVIFHQRQLSFENCLYRRCIPSKVVFHWRGSSIEGGLPLKGVSQWRSSSIESCLPLMLIFPQRLSSIECCLPSKVIFHRRLSSIESRLRPEVIFNLRLSFRSRTKWTRSICQGLEFDKNG